MRLVDIIRKHRRAFLFAVSLVVIEKLAWIVEPTLFGRLLDSLIAVFGSKEAVSYATPLILWVGAFAINSGVGAARRSIDEKIYSNMFTNIDVEVTESSQHKGLDVAKTASRVELSRDYVTLLSSISRSTSITSRRAKPIPSSPISGRLSRAPSICRTSWKATPP